MKYITYDQFCSILCLADYTTAEKSIVTKFTLFNVPEKKAILETSDKLEYIFNKNKNESIEFSGASALLFDSNGVQIEIFFYRPLEIVEALDMLTYK